MKDYLFSFLMTVFCFGILLAANFKIPNTSLFICVFVGIIAFLFCFFKLQKLIGVSVLILICCFGVTRYHQFNHHDNFKEVELEQKQTLNLEIKEKLNDSERFYTYKSTIRNQRKNVLLYLRKSSNQNLKVGDFVWVNTELQNLYEPKNPYQFNYANYLRNKQIYYQAFADSIIFFDGNSNTIQSKSASLKERIKKSLIKNGANQKSIQLISALLLGDRTDFDAEQKAQFAKAGVMHLLAISGLHVGLIFGIVYFCFSFLIRLRHGKKLQILLSLGFVWLFAAFVNFSPSVSRACLMLSIYFGSVLLNRTPNIFHTIGLSAFVLLFINPNFLFDVGFQLSYCAVFFIVWLLPVWQKIINPKTKVLQYFTNLVGVSICAQLGVLPLSIYYFHQFSGLFLIGNLVLIPMAGFLIIEGFVCIISTSILPIFNWVMQLYNWLSIQVFWFIRMLSELDLFIFSNLYISRLQVVFLFALIVSIRFLFLKKLNYRILISCLALFLIIQVEKGIHLYKSYKKEELIVFSQNKNQIIGIRNKSNLDVFIENLEDSMKIQTYILEPYIRNEHIKNVHVYPIEKELYKDYLKTKNIIQWNDKVCFIGDQIPENFNEFNLMILNSNKNLDCASDSLNQTIVFHSYEENSNCVQYWNTNKKGAFILRF